MYTGTGAASGPCPVNLKSFKGKTKEICLFVCLVFFLNIVTYLPTTPFKKELLLFRIFKVQKKKKKKVTFFFCENSDDVHLITKVHIFVELIARKVLPAFHFNVLVYSCSPLYLFNCPNPSIFHQKKNPETSGIALEYDVQWPILLFLTFQCCQVCSY